MKNNIEFFFKILNSDSFQKKLKRINLIISIISIFYISSLIRDEFNISVYTFTLNISEVIVLLIVYFFIGLTWVKFNSSNNNKEKTHIFFDWSFSNIGKYFPGGLGVISIRLDQQSKKPDSKKIMFGLLEEQFLIPILSLPVLLITNIYLKNIDSTNNLKIIIFMIVIQFVTIFVFKKVYFKNNKINKNSMLNYSNYIFISLILTNLFTFLIFYNFGFRDYLPRAIYYLIASYIGLFFVGVPAGLGIREAIFIFLLNTTSSTFSNFDILIHIRLLYLICDIFYGFSGFLYRAKKSFN